MFGEGARLDLGGGSFYGSTADSILFDSGEFSATDLDNPPLLTINAPIGFSFRDNPASITNRSTQADVGLEVAPGATIGLIGGNLNFEGGLVTAPGGLVELGGLSVAGEVSFADGSFSFPEEVAKSNISLTNNAEVDISSDGGGLITVDANNLQLSGTSLFLAGINEGLGSADAVAGTIQINSNSITATEQSQIRADNSGTGRGGTINITTDSLDFNDGSAIVVSTFGRGDAGTVNLTARDASFSQEFSGIYSTVGLRTVETEPKIADANGNAGAINVNTDTLSLTEGGRILTSTAGMGDAGTIDINATGEVSFSGRGTTIIEEFNGPVISSSNSQARSQSVGGDAGEVNITAGSFELLDIAGIIVNNAGTGNVGKINLDVEGNILVARTGLILAQATSPSSQGEGSGISITGGSFTAESSLILANSRGAGNAGSINFDIDGILTISDNTQIASTLDAGVGNGGNVSIDSGEFNLTGNSEIRADTTGAGNAGNITINIARDINLDNSSQIQSQARQIEDGNTRGDAGNINITTGGSLFSTNGNLILTDSQAVGNSGNISITAAEQITLSGVSDDGLTSQIVASLSRDTSEGTGGTIDITAGELILDDVAFIASNTVSDSTGSAGEITLNVDSLRLQNNSYVNVFTGNNENGGAITVNARNLDLASGGKILAATDGNGDAGNINLNISEQITIDNAISSPARSISGRDNASDLLLESLQLEPSGIYVDATENATGIGGNVFINSQNLELSNDGIITASSNSSRGGSIDITTGENLTLNGGSLISAEAANNGDGGNVDINSQFVIAFPDGNNDILASAEGGMGGNININAESLFGIQERPANNFTNDIDASSQFSLDGNVNVNVFNFDPIQGVVELPTATVEAENTVAQTCSANDAIANTNSFTITGKGGVPPAPELPLNSYNILTGDNLSTIPEPLETAKGKIQPARGIEVKPDGSIALVAYHTDNSGRRISPSQTNCSSRK